MKRMLIPGLLLFVVAGAGAAEADFMMFEAARRALRGESSIAVPKFEAVEVRAAWWGRRKPPTPRPLFKITTDRTDVCADGKYDSSDLKRWAAYQKRHGWNARFSDGSRQGNTATGPINPFRVHYVVVPRNRRDLLYTRVEVCVLATGRCAWGETREIGPRFGELSVKGMMDLELNAHPDSGRYNGKISYTFYP